MTYSELNCLWCYGTTRGLTKRLTGWKGSSKIKAVTALQTALCFTGNTFASLSVERRRSILWQLNQQLTPLAEEGFENDGKLFSNDFRKRAKERTDAIRSLSRSSSASQEDQTGARPTRNVNRGSHSQRTQSQRLNLSLLNKIYPLPYCTSLLPPVPTMRPPTLPILGTTIPSTFSLITVPHHIIAARLKFFISNWKLLQCNWRDMDTQHNIEGFQIPLESPPKQTHLRECSLPGRA